MMAMGKSFRVNAVALLATILMFLLCACGNTSQTAGTSVPADINKGAVQVGDDTMFIMAGDYFRDPETGEKVDTEEFVETAKIKDMQWNDEGDTVTITMDTDDYNELIATLDEQVRTTYALMVDDEQFAVYAESIEADEGFHVVTVTVDEESFNEEDAFYTVAPQIAIYASMYQDYRGTNGNDKTVIDFVAKDSGKILLSLSFPEAWAHIMN